jgi:hypothetical protein
VKLGYAEKLSVFRNKKLVSGLVTKVRRAARDTLAQFHATHVEQEPAFTDRLLGAMAVLLNGQQIGGLWWAAKTLTDRGAGSQEHEFGADFLSVFRISSEDFKVAKGFLAQAKLVEPDQQFSKKDFENLRKQCEKMLEHSSSSYVFLYSQKSGILIVPAVEVVDARASNPHELTSKEIGQFFGDHFECFIGDKSIQSADRKGLEELRRNKNARDVFYLAGHERLSELRGDSL